MILHSYTWLKYIYIYILFIIIILKACFTDTWANVRLPQRKILNPNECGEIDYMKYKQHNTVHNDTVVYILYGVYRICEEASASSKVFHGLCRLMYTRLVLLSGKMNVDRKHKTHRVQDMKNHHMLRFLDHECSPSSITMELWLNISFDRYTCTCNIWYWSWLFICDIPYSKHCPNCSVYSTIWIFFSGHVTLLIRRVVFSLLVIDCIHCSVVSVKLATCSDPRIS